MSPAQRFATYFHVHLVSDSTGETLNALARAVCARFDDLEAAPGVVIHTIVDPEIRTALEEGCRRLDMACLPALDPLVASAALSGRRDHEPGRRAAHAGQRLLQPHGRAELRHRP